MHTDRLLAALGWWWWEVTWYTAAAQLGEQVIRKLKVADLADPAVLFRGNDSLLLEAERACATPPTPARSRPTWPGSATSWKAPTPSTRRFASRPISSPNTSRWPATVTSAPMNA